VAVAGAAAAGAARYNQTAIRYQIAVT